MTSYWASVLAPVLIDAIAVLGLFVIVSSGRISAGHAAYLGLGSYAGAVAASALGTPLGVTLLVATATGATAGLLFALAAERLQHWFFAVATLAFGQVLTGAINNMSSLGGPLGLYGIRVQVDVAASAIALSLVIVFVLAFELSRWGRATRAVRDSAIAAQALGINVQLVHIRSFVIGAALAGLAGGLRVEYMGMVNPGELSFERSLLLLVYLTVGGSGNILGALSGTLVLGLLPEYLRFVGNYRFEFYGVLVLLVMIYRPAGLFPSAQWVLRSLQYIRQPARFILRRT